MCDKEEGSDVQGGWSGSNRSRDWDRSQGIGNRLSQLKKDGFSVDRTSFVSDAIKCFGISRLSVSKVDVLEGAMEGKHLL